MSLGFAMSAVYFTTKNAVYLCSFFMPGILFLPSCLASRHGSGGLVLASGCKKNLEHILPQYSEYILLQCIEPKM